jgi:hypothetical protein
MFLSLFCFLLQPGAAKQSIVRPGEAKAGLLRRGV